MWRDYSKSYLKNNRGAGISVMAAAFMATLFLSILCSLFFNFRIYEIEKITSELGGHFEGVESAVVNEALSEDKTGVDIYFYNAALIYQDMPLITEKPPLLMTFYVAVLIAVSFSLVLIIRNSFEISMNARVHQFGIFSSIGATPKQIRTCLLQEAAALCAVPVFAGALLGVGISFGVIELINIFAADVAGRHRAVFQYHPLVLAITILSAVLTVFFSAWIPAAKLSRMTPLQAISNPGGLGLKKRGQSPVLPLIFGVEGELAANALKAQKKSLFLSTLSLLLSFLGFTVMLCFFTLSGISTRYTYFERYQDVWDVMATVKNTDLEDFNLTEEVREITGVDDSVAYQKAEETVVISPQQQSEELLALGGLKAAAGEEAAEEGESFRASAPVVILDDESFLKYCLQIGITPSTEGAVVLNRIWDSINSNFRERDYIPFVREERKTTVLTDANGVSAEIPVLSYTQQVPVLREEYADYALVHFMPLSMWKTASEKMEGGEPTTYIRILANDSELHELDLLEAQVLGLAGQEYDVGSENRIRERASNDKMIRGYMLILGAFCSLLAAIGIANVFTNTLGFLRQRKREFAQYLSIGLTPANMRKMFWIEALVIAGRPFLITLPFTVLIMAFMINASHLDPMVFLSEAPVIPIFVFALFIICFVSLAYYIGGRRILNCDLSGTLRNDTCQM